MLGWPNASAYLEHTDLDPDTTRGCCSEIGQRIEQFSGLANPVTSRLIWTLRVDCD